MAISEFAFSVDDFQNPKVFKNGEAVCTLLVRLLLLEPGTIQSHPEAGVGLISKYRYSVEGSAAELRGDFQRQIEKYLPQLQGVHLSVVERDHKLFITAEIGDVLYGISFDQSTLKIDTDYKSLSDL